MATRIARGLIFAASAGLLWGASARAEQSGDLFYTVVGGAQITLTGYAGTGGALTIPSEIAGLPVTRIGNSAFSGRAELTGHLAIPDSVTSIEDAAFLQCAGLTGVIVGGGAVTVGEGAFSACSRLAGIYFKGTAVAAAPIGSTATVYTVAWVSWPAMFGGRPTAVWQSRAVFDAGAGAAPIGAAFFDVGAAYGDLPEPTWEGYTFLGWRTGDEGAGSPVTKETAVPVVVGDHTLYADWEANVYTLQLEAEGAVVDPELLSVTFGASYGELPTPERPGYAFGGWWTEPGGTGVRITPESTVTTGQDHTLYAKWAADPSMGPSALAGVAFGLNLPDAYAAATKVVFKGLPPGLKYNALTQTVTGVPTKAGSYTVTLSAAGMPALVFTITVGSLPSWAWGAFNGYVASGGSATLTVAAGGKASGKLSVCGTNYAFSAASYEVGGSEASGFKLSAVARAGNAALPLSLAVTRAAASSSLSVAAGAIGDEPAVLWRDVWKETAGVAPVPFAGYYTATLPGDQAYGSGYLTFTVDKAGKVKIAGKLADGTAVSQGGTLVLDADGRAFAVVYLAPAAYKGGRLFGLAELVSPNEGKTFLRPLGGVPFAWRSGDPRATAEYGAGFVRATGLSGGWYSKTDNLYAYYQGGRLEVRTDADAQAPTLSVGAGRQEADWWNPSGVAVTVATNRSGVMTGLSAPAAGKPTDADRDGAWDYGADNAVGLKLSLTRATGLFKGSFLAWFDYPENKHVSRSLAVEGALTPEREDKTDGVEGRGFFLWPDLAPVPASAKTYAFKWSYDFLLLDD